MGIDLFELEQQIYDAAMNREETVRNGKPFNFSEYTDLAKQYGDLLKQLRRATYIADRTTTVLHESNLDLTDKIHYDALTGIFNRRYIGDNLPRILNSLIRSGGGQLSIIMVDVDFFKKYNDEYGHSAGDACLKAVAGTLSKSVLRSGDFVARYGGEEFIGVLPNTDENGAREVAERMLENVRALNIPHNRSTAADCVTISVGVTAGNVLYLQNGSDFIKRADEALYTSKQNGRNRYTYVDFREGKT